MLHSKRRKSKANDSKKKENTVINIVKVELLELKQVYFKLSLMVRKLKITTKVDLKLHEELFC